MKLDHTWHRPSCSHFRLSGKYSMRSDSIPNPIFAFVLKAAILLLKWPSDPLNLTSVNQSFVWIFLSFDPFDGRSVFKPALSSKPVHGTSLVEQILLFYHPLVASQSTMDSSAFSSRWYTSRSASISEWISFTIYRKQNHTGISKWQSSRMCTIKPRSVPRAAAYFMLDLSDI